MPVPSLAMLRSGGAYLAYALETHSKRHREYNSPKRYTYKGIPPIIA